MPTIIVGAEETGSVSSVIPRYEDAPVSGSVNGCDGRMNSPSAPASAPTIARSALEEKDPRRAHRTILESVWNAGGARSGAVPRRLQVLCRRTALPSQFLACSPTARGF
jgi:hypothetical protein